VQRNQGAGAKKQMADQKDEQKEELKWKRGNNCRWTESGFSTSLYYPQPAWTREHRKRLARRAKVGQKKKVVGHWGEVIAVDRGRSPLEGPWGGISCSGSKLIGALNTPGALGSWVTVGRPGAGQGATDWVVAAH